MRTQQLFHLQPLAITWTIITYALQVHLLLGPIQHEPVFPEQSGGMEGALEDSLGRPGNGVAKVRVNLGVEEYGALGGPHQDVVTPDR